MCGVDWECGRHSAGGEDDFILRVVKGFRRTMQVGASRSCGGLGSSRERCAGRNLQSCENQRNPEV